MFRLVILT